MFNKMGINYLVQRSKKELFIYYSKINFSEKALEMAHLLINN
jgi:HTH-type transcriptional regulator, quorum sensing regulator NprR